MKTLLFSFVVLLFSVTVFAQASPEKVAQVAAGRLKEARASWWGFDAADSTKFLRAAIDSKVPKLIVDTMPTPWITEPLQLVDDQEIVFEKGCVVQAKRGAFKGKADSLFNIILKKNVTLRGNEGATLKMWIADYHGDQYEAAEWRHAVNIKSSENILVENLALVDSGGDGIYLGVAKRGVPCKNITIRNVVCDNNNRQGISVISAENLLIEDTVMKNTRGTAPKAGIDFEPNHPSEVLINCVMKNCLTENNGGCGYTFYLPNLHRSSKPISIRLENCTARGDSSSGFGFITGNLKDLAVEGTVEVVDCRFERSGGNGIVVRGKPTDGVNLIFENCVIENCGGKPEVLPIRVNTRRDDEVSTGNIRLGTVKVIDSVDRPVFEYKDTSRRGLAPEKIEGTVELERNGKRSTYRIDDDWIRKNCPMKVVKQIPRVDLNGLQLQPLESNLADTDRTLPLLRSRNGGEFLFYVEKGSPLRFTLFQGQVAKYAGKEEKVKFLSPSGKAIPLPNLKFKEETDYRLDAAPESGVYRLSVGVGGNWVSVKKSNRPVVLAAAPREAHLISTQGEFFFYVPEGTKEFGIRISGEGGERVKATLFDPSGTKAWSEDDIEELAAFEGTTPGVWKIKFERPKIGIMEDFYVSLVGIPPLLGYSPDFLLKK